MSLFRTHRTRRRDDQSGFIAVQTLGIVVLLLATLLMIVGAAAANRNAAREGKEFTQARRGTDLGTSLLLQQFNAPATRPYHGGPVYGAGRTGSLAASGDFTGATWSTSYATRTATVESVSDDTTQDATLPIRSRLVGSYKSDSTGGYSYGVPAGPPAPGADSFDALGAWGSAVSTSADSAAGPSAVWGAVTVAADPTRGTPTDREGKPGTWDAYGGTISNAGNARVVAYSSSIDAPTSGADSFGRSQFNAYLDTRIHGQRVKAVRDNAADCSGSRDLDALGTSGGDYACHRGDYTLGAINRALPGVTTAVVRGNLTITDNIWTGAGEVHLYVDGSVTFRKTTSTLDLRNLYIYAPNGSCDQADSTTVQLLGSVACKSVHLTGGSSNSVRWRRPADQPAASPYTPNVEAPQPVYFFEKPGFSDQWTP